MRINHQLKTEDLKGKINELWISSANKIKSISAQFDGASGSPVVTIKGKYEPRSWTDWTQGFQFGSELLQFDATGDGTFLEMGIEHIRANMTPHISHVGVHDHGFNNLSTYGNLLRMINEGRVTSKDWAKDFCVMAIRLSAAVQANRWTAIPEGGYIYSFNGPHSLFVDTIRTIRILVAGHQLDHYLAAENDIRVSLLKRAYQHALATAKYAIFYGEGRDQYDVWGRTAHESVFNINDGNFRSSATQQGYSGYSTWTRGLSWAMLGFAEQLEYLENLDSSELDEIGGKKYLEEVFLRAAKATCDFYIEYSALDGIPYWDTGAPGLVNLKDWKSKKADPFNDWEPVDSSAAAIGAQGLLRLGKYLEKTEPENAKKYWSAGLTIANTLFDTPYLSNDTNHQGLVLHSIYHQPKGWDHVPEGSKVANGEACMWGDYHARELAIYLQKIINKDIYYTFFSGIAY